MCINKINLHGYYDDKAKQIHSNPGEKIAERQVIGKVQIVCVCSIEHYTIGQITLKIHVISKPLCMYCGANLITTLTVCSNIDSPYMHKIFEKLVLFYCKPGKHAYKKKQYRRSGLTESLGTCNTGVAPSTGPFKMISTSETIREKKLIS